LRHAEIRRLPYTPDQMFDLVGDVESYPAFVPWIKSMRVWNKHLTEAEIGLDAEVEIGFSLLRERFATRVRCDRAQRGIAVNLLHGPFKRLENQWRFSADPIGTQIDFSIDFEFRSMMLERILAANMGKAVNRLIGCFEARAKVLYGPAQPVSQG